MKKYSKKYFFSILLLLLLFLMPLQTYAASKNVAKLTIVSNDNGKKDLGHAFLVLTNTSSKAIKVGPYRLAKNQQVTLGMRNGFAAHLKYTGGAYLNVEAANPGVYKSFAYKTISITEDNIKTIYNFFKKNSYYETTGDIMFHNCTTFAVRAWNKVASKAYKMKENLVDEPWKLKNKIAKLSGGKKATKLVGPVLKKSCAADSIYYVKTNGDLIPYCLPKTGIVTIKDLNCNQIKLTWKQVSDKKITGQQMVTGYKIYYATGENDPVKTVTIKKQSTTQYTLKNLKANQRYVFKVVTLFDKGGFKVESEPTATASKQTKNCKVSLNKTSATIDLAKSRKLSLTASSTGTHTEELKKVKWSSSNTNVATVSSSGVVTGQRKGTATITATIHGKKATCKLTVTGKYKGQIFTVSDLKNVSKDLSGTYYLMNDLNLGSSMWTPLGTDTAPFTGKFYGNGHTISNLRINTTAGNQGLFGVTSGAYIERVEVKGSVTGGTYSAGIVGHLKDNSKLSYCINRASVSGKDQVGGVVGRVGKSSVDHCLNYGAVSASGRGSGGITADIYPSGQVSYSVNMAAVSGGSDITGGVVGGCTSGPISYCYNAGSVTGKSRVGGIAGDNAGYAGSRTSNYFLKTLTVNAKYSVYGSGSGTFTNTKHAGLQNAIKAITNKF